MLNTGPIDRHRGQAARASLTALGAPTAGLRRVERGEALFRQGHALSALYEVELGQFKTQRTDEAGRRQVIGFHLAGELLGLDGIDDGGHRQDAIALEDAQVSVIPYAAFNAQAARSEELQHELHRIMGRELTRVQEMLLLLGTLGAEARLAAFLVDLAKRLQARGWSAKAMLLRMSRIDIASYLGLTVETVSRNLTRMQQLAVLRIDHRDIEILDPAALERIATGGP
ncbi:MAG: helix-turn-helix domain-containing protein [Burkholderiales bacterium]|nr:helix-turn-helix domain-containing protein [Burkholderiales bacterium]MDE1927533.1 helix-turn-helix domain-containing protein [Burkholderiales bacterium]MDE2161142.1 helix-turn-helix domain-containing protein [Burkholderiales bacterium]MDE2504043.1 helix-turn-helix domain-containing protein [Burkholderiales bacterium]